MPLEDASTFSSLDSDSPVGVELLPIDPLDQAIVDLYRVNEELIRRLTGVNQENFP